MPRGNSLETKVHYKGKEDDFIIFVEDAKSVQNWKADKSVPLAQVVQAFKIFVTHKHGAQGSFDGASNSTLENEFGTHVDEECIKQILEKGTLQETELSERTGPKNDSQGARISH